MNFLIFVSLSILLNFCKAGKFEGAVVATPPPPPAPIYNSTDTYPELPTPTSAPLPTTSTSSDPMKGITSTVAPTPPPAEIIAPVVTPPPAPAPSNQNNNGWIPYAIAGAATIGAIALLGSNNNDSSKPPQGFILGDLEKSNCKKEYLRYPNTIQNYAYGICQGTLGSEKSPNMGTCIDQCVAAAKL